MKKYAERLNDLEHLVSRRLKETTEDLLEELKSEQPRDYIIYELCRDYVAAQDCLDTTDELIEDDFDRDCDEEDNSNFQDLDCGCVPAEKVFEHDHEPLLTSTKSKAEVKIKYQHNDEEPREISLEKEQIDKLIGKLAKGDIDGAFQFADTIIDREIKRLNGTLTELGDDLKNQKKKLEEKTDRTEKEEQRLGALDELFARVRKAFSDD